MNTKHTKRPPILFGLGMIFLTWGGVSIYVEQDLDVLSSMLSLLGAILLLSCFILKRKLSQGGLQFLQWKRVGVIMAVVVFISVFTLGMNYFAYSLSFRWDVTKDNQHTLTASTIEFMKDLNAPVKLTALYVGLPPKYLEDLLKEYERVSNGKITTEIIDPIEKISYAAQFGSVISGQERKLIIRSGDERRDVDFTHSSLTEEQLTNGIVRTARESRHIYFLTGHGEYSLSNEDNQGLSLFARLLGSNNMTSQILMLGIEDAIPEECDVLIIAGPRNDLTEKEQALIQAYLSKGGNALFLIENVVVTTPDKPLTEIEERTNPSLNSILNDWGVNIGTDIVVDLNSHVGDDVGSPATKNYIPHKAITHGLDYTFYVRPRSISVLKERRPSIKLAPIVMTASKEKSWGETNRTLDVHFDAAVDALGPVPISYVILEEKKTDELSDTRIIVFTDADFLTNAYINQYSNAAMGLNIVNWLSELDYHVFLDQKEIKVERLDLTSKQRRMIAAILFLIPLLIAAGGIFVWLRRKL